MAYRVKQKLLLDEQDEYQQVGSEFTIQYMIGATQVKEPFENAEEVLDEFVKNTTGQLGKGSAFRLVVGQRGAVFYDSEGTILHSFELCNISDVFYSKDNREYSKHFVLVGKESCLSCVKAYVFVCENKANARRLYQTFIEIFQLALEVTRKKQAHEPERNNPDETLSYLESPRVFFRAGETGSSLNRNNYNSKQLSKWNTRSLPTSPGLESLDSEGNSDIDYLEEAFTEFAQSRSGFAG